MSRPQITDRIATHIAESGGRSDAETIARDFLRLARPGGAAAQALVRAILAGDGRFREEAAGVWGVATPVAPGLDPPVLLCALEIPAAAAREPWLWRITAELWGAEVPRAVHRGPTCSDALARLREWLRAHPVATRRPRALRRWLGAQERLQAWSEVAPCVLDLAAWARRLEIPDIAYGPGDPDREIRSGGELLERITAAAESRGLRSWPAVAAATERDRAAGRERVWSRDWSIRPEQLAELPEEPGVYRFFTRDGTLLYVGKARNLRRRIADYFRPLDARSQRRAALLEQLDRVAIEGTPTELEALLREAAAIREARPPWNVQVTLGVEPSEFSSSERDLVLLLPAVGGGATLFALSAERVALAPLLGVPDPQALVVPVREFFVSQDLAAPLREIAAPERQLVRRWLRWETGDAGAVVLRLTDFTTYRGVAEAIRDCLALSREGESPPPGRMLVRERS